MKQPVYRLRVPHQVAGGIRNLHPSLKRKVRSALETIAAEPFSGKALKDELDALRSFRVGKFRVIYRMKADRLIEIVAVGPRERIYEETYRLITRVK
jgi:mRNA interferase RelE/StbE